MSRPTRFTTRKDPVHTVWVGPRVSVAVPVFMKSNSSWNISLSHKALAICVNVAGTESILEGW